jgi:hypothetical protein
MLQGVAARVFVRDMCGACQLSDLLDRRAALLG